MTVVYLVSLHLGVPCPHLSQLNLFTVTASETPWCYSEPWGFSLHAHIIPRASWAPPAPRCPPSLRCPTSLHGVRYSPGMLSILPICRLLLLTSALHMCTEEKSFYPPSNILSSPQTHTTLYPSAPPLLLSFFKSTSQTHAHSPVTPVSPSLPIWYFSGCPVPPRHLCSHTFAGQKTYEWINTWFKGIWAIRKLCCDILQCTANFSVTAKLPG